MFQKRSLFKSRCDHLSAHQQDHLQHRHVDLPESNSPTYSTSLAFCGTLPHFDVANLTQTSRKMHKKCTSSPCRMLDLRSGKILRILHSLTSLHALATNTLHVRILGIGVIEHAYYYNFVLAFEQEFQIDEPMMNMMIQRHLTTLGELRFQKDNKIFSEISVSTILKGCCNLEALHIPCTRTGGFYVTLDNALEYPWTCAKLTEVETQHFSRLENLYRQIGSLTALQELDLTMARLYELDPEDDMNLDDNRINSRSTSFPAMLSLRNTSTNRPGYLQHLSGLKQLKKLCGSVSAETAETVVTMGWAEVRWMDQNWPELRQADFFEEAISVSEQFRWLQDKRKSEGRDLEGKTLI
ncbi:hypothetical protein BKA57DRAFT_507986 [Linnemannia elongata]|nr:hypothetical protein BKA57DRAFT_507986 [Linnemannia elongata]